MRERPILFSGPMVRAILEGRKTQTRRAVKVPRHIKPDGLLPMTWERHDASLREQGVSDDARPYLTGPRWEGEALFGNLYGDPGYGVIHCPFGQRGDRLWVRETWAPMCRVADPYCECESPEAIAANHYVEYRGDTGNPYPGEWPAEDARENDDAPRWRPSIHMPRWASRLTLEITGVRVERVQEICGMDAKREGVDIPAHLPHDGADLDHARWGFRALWDALNAARGHGWDANPWVWVLEFRRVS